MVLDVIDPQPIEYIIEILDVLAAQERQGEKFYIDLNLTYRSDTQPTLKNVLGPNLSSEHEDLFADIVNNPCTKTEMCYRLRSISELEHYLDLVDKVKFNEKTENKLKYCKLFFTISIDNYNHHYNLQLDNYRYVIHYQNNIIQDGLYYTLLKYEGIIKKGYKGRIEK